MSTARNSLASIALVAIPFALLLTAGDNVFHVRTGTLSYDWHPQLFDQTILVPFTFWLAAVGMLLTVRLLHPGAPATTASQVVDGLALVALAYLASGRLAPKHAVAYAVALLVGWVLRLLARPDWRAAVAIGLAIACGGVLGEAGLSALGEFSYTHPDVLGVPWWLFPLYLHGSLVAIDLVSVLRRSSETA
ncbi:MAG: putative rane protein [Aeromicrobium sp.]|nr:putative rane protein [Aeromicrobium sp.]